MIFSRLVAIVGMIVSLTLSASLAMACPAPDNLSTVRGRDQCLSIKTYQSDGKSGAPVLFIVLHGDGSAGGPVDYHYDVAARLASDNSINVIAVAMLRPGYGDRAGNSSTGSDLGRRDSYTPQYIDDISDAISNLKTFHRANRVVLVGHSGGAAISAVILGRHPGLADAGTLVACPCDLVAWRQRENRSPWMRSLSPHRYVGDIPRHTRIVALVGSDDTNTPPSLSENYVSSLTSRGVEATFVLLQGANHNRAFTRPEVVEAAVSMGK